MSQPNCPTCGRFMCNLKLVSRIRIEVHTGEKRTHICPLEEFSFITNEWKHYKTKEELKEAEQKEIKKNLEELRKIPK